MGSGELPITSLPLYVVANGNRNRDHTTKIGDSKGCMKCCVGEY